MIPSYIPRIALLNSQMEIINNCVKSYLPNATVFIFGSRVKGTAKKYSDVDIALQAEEIIANTTLNNIKKDLEKSLPYFVDVIDLQATTSEFFSTIQHELQKI